MKKIHAALIALISLILVGSLVIGGLQLYTSQRTLPDEINLAGWEIGGMNIDDVQSGLEQRLRALEALPLILKADGAADLSPTLKQAGLTYKAPAFLQALQGLKEGNLWDRFNARRNFPRSWSLASRLDIKQLKDILSPAWERSAFGVPVDATRVITPGDQVVYTPGTNSREVNWTALETTLLAAVPTDFQQLEDLQNNPLILEVPLTVLEPAITLKELKDQGIERKITQFSTSLGSSGPGRTHNVDAAAKAVNGTILPPDAVFDYGKAIEKARQEYGFREAPVIVGGRLQPGMGGGICQVSSTLYNAALRTGLEIVERRNHSVPVNYLPKGQDATFAEGYINFRFRNNTGKYIIIQAEVQGRALTVKLFGTFPKNISYDIQSKTVEILPPKDVFIRDASLSPGSSRVIQQGKTGYVVETHITRYVDGKAVETTQLSRDVYPAQKRLIAANQPGAGRNPTPEATERPFMEDGVRSSQ
ncbi:VanW family protein [Paenibacillus agri]|uniref:VanW family protein n=1 Tax=Paenibacillus agri TaxID=2744309 RepID=A0A850ENR9_9BACL|nr:VanW family protein [Paenibacillus agri]NUU60964.1 VanW family protein [Paenibacillus agri]